MKNLKSYIDWYQVNEGIFRDYDDLYKSVKKWTEKNINSNAVVEKDDKNNITVHIRYDSSYDSKFNNLSDENITKNLRTKTQSLESMYNKKFRDFFISGINSFSISSKVVNVTSSSSLLKRKVKFNNPNNYRSMSERMYKYNEISFEDLGDYNEYIQKYGKNNLGIVDIYLLISVNNIK